MESATERVSEMVAQPYLQSPRAQIMSATSICRRKRHEFVRAVGKGLIPPDTPPSMRRGKHRLPGLLGMDPVDEVSFIKLFFICLVEFTKFSFTISSTSFS